MIAAPDAKQHPDRIRCCDYHSGRRSVVECLLRSAREQPKLMRDFYFHISELTMQRILIVEDEQKQVVTCSRDWLRKAIRPIFNNGRDGLGAASKDSMI